MLDQLIADFLVSRRASGSRPRTLDWYEWNLRGFAAWVVAEGRDWTQAKTINAWLDQGRVDKAATTIEGRYRALSAFFNWLVEMADEYDEVCLPVSPLQKVRRPKVRDRDVQRRRAQADEYRQLVRSIPQETWLDLRDRALIVLLFATGLRVGEAAALRISDFDLRERRLRVEGKNGNVDLVPFHADLGPALLAYLMARPAHHGPEVWLSNSFRGGQRCVLTASGIRQILERRCEAAGIRYLNPHSFRHGSIMYLLRKTGNLKFASSFARHSSTAITAKIYTDYEVDALQDEYDQAWDCLENEEESHRS